jgi:hypothetical protein
MDLRLLLSHFADAGTRGALARWLFVVCACGFVASLAALAALGYGLDRWVFVLVVWTVLLFIPLRILIEALPTVGGRMREAVLRRVAADPRRYQRPELLPIVVGGLFARDVTMPRIAKPQQAHKAREAATAILGRTTGGTDAAGVLTGAIRATLAAAAHEAVAISAAATGVASETIQNRWEGARALGALAALIQVLAAAYAERWGGPPALPELGGRPLADYLDAALDYCDEAALQVDALPWTEPPLASPLAPGAVEGVRAAWHAFVAAGTPAPRALEAFLATVLPAR